MNAPISGEMMAALVEACENSHDHDNNPVRLTPKHIGREINANASFSVLG
jgi:hypothetical protein